MYKTLSATTKPTVKKALEAGINGTTNRTSAQKVVLECDAAVSQT